MILKPKKLTGKIALTVGLLLLVIWSILGTGASVAWFTDESPLVRNVFNFAEFDLDVQYRNSNMTDYAPLEIDSNVFLDEALYEPNYTQVVYLKVKNNGSVDMNYKLSADVLDVTVGKSVLGNEIYLPNYLKYGVVFADSETMLDRELAQKNAAEDMAQLKLNNFTDNVIITPGGERYIALVVYMPDYIDNVANYRSDDVPTVKLGLTVYAEQSVKE